MSLSVVPVVPVVPVVIARWNTRGNDFIELTRVEQGYYRYKGNGCSGGFPSPDDASAIEHVLRPWGKGGAGPVFVMSEYRKSVKRVI